MEVTRLKSPKLLLDEIHATKKVQDALGREYDLNSNIDQEEGKFLESLIIGNKFNKSIEIGCAFGISSLYICGALCSEYSKHTIVDPFQSSDWSNIGVDHLRRAGLNNFELIEKQSEIALPELMKQGDRFDFAFVDGWHTFDHTLVDMFYLNRMLNIGGIMVIDDVGMKGVEKAVNYFLNYPAYEFIGGIPLQRSRSRNWINQIILKPFRKLTRLLPHKIRNEVFSPLITSKVATGYSMVALKKVCNDERPWNWYTNF